MYFKDWSSFHYWESIYREFSPSLGGPFNELPLTQSSMFFWAEAGLPSINPAIHGKWSCFPAPEALAGFLRFVAFPLFFETWLYRGQWDATPKRFRQVEEFLDLAKQVAQTHAVVDIPLMRKLIEDLDALFELSSSQIPGRLHEIVDRFNNRWAYTKTWHFEIRIFDSPLAAGQEVYRRKADIGNINSMSEAQWLEVCRRAIYDQQSRTEFFRVLSESAWF